MFVSGTRSEAGTFGIGFQKSAVSPASVSRGAVHSHGAVFGRDVAETALLVAMGTRLAGSSAESRRISAPRFWMKASSTASAGMRTVWSR